MSYLDTGRLSRIISIYVVIANIVLGFSSNRRSIFNIDIRNQAFHRHLFAIIFMTSADKPYSTLTYIDRRQKKTKQRNRL